MEAARTSETLVNFYQSTWRYNPEDNHLRTHSRENLKSYKIIEHLLLLLHPKYINSYAEQVSKIIGGIV
jgi:hypothetical protein